MSRTRMFGIAAVALAAVLLVAACKSSTPTTQSGQTSAGGDTNASSGSGDSTGPANIKDSKYLGLTKLTEHQLCGTMSASEASGILGKPAANGKFTNTMGLGIVCEWQVGGSSDTELYVGISTLLDWKGAQAIEQLLKPTSLTIAGHPALGADPSHGVTYANVIVAVGAAHDPGLEFRAPTQAQAKQLASLLTPRLIALGS